MKKRNDSFKRALAEANKELSRAIKQREQAQAQVAKLNVQIPALQRTIAALQGQVDGTIEAFVVDKIKESFKDVTESPKPLKFTDVVPLPEINSSMGSIPATGVLPPARELTDDELLQMPTEEDILKTSPKKANDATDPFTDNI